MAARRNGPHFAADAVLRDRRLLHGAMLMLAVDPACRPRKRSGDKKTFAVQRGQWV